MQVSKPAASNKGEKTGSSMDKGEDSSEELKEYSGFDENFV